MHTILFQDEKLSDDFVEMMAATGTFQVTTLSVMDGPLTFWDLERLNDPMLELVVPEEELNYAKNSFMGWFAHRAWARSVDVPFIFRSIVVRNFFKEELFSASLSIAQDAIKRLHEAGVRIVAGTDTAARVSAPYEFHGPALLREIELIGQAGLTPMEAIQTATINAAEMLGLDKEIGTVEVGKKAELVIVRDDPLKDLANLRSILWTVQGGVAKTPEQWMSQ
jgi:hypothetical protein